MVEDLALLGLSRSESDWAGQKPGPISMLYSRSESDWVGGTKNAGVDNKTSRSERDWAGP